MINTQEELDDVCRRLADEPVLGIDTEFLRVRTYYPKLALVQVSTPTGIHCVDPLVEKFRLDPLWAVLSDPGIVKVMHAARQDMEVFRHTAGLMPGPLFDTQIAAGLTGRGEQVGYAALVEAEFGERLPKTSQRTDWTRRPLTEAQLGYAENDVRYLLPLYRRLQDELESLGRLEWAREDCERVLDPALYEADPEQAYRRVGRGVNLNPGAQQALKRLCAWRERTAQHRDLPRHWVVDDETLVKVSASQPQTLGALQSLDGVREEVGRRDGGAIVDCIRESAGDAAVPLYSRRQSLDPDQKALKGALIQVLGDVARDLGVAESVLATRSELERVVRGDRPSEVIDGWRWQVIGGAVGDVVAGASSVGDFP